VPTDAVIELSRTVATGTLILLVLKLILESEEKLIIRKHFFVGYNTLLVWFIGFFSHFVDFAKIKFVAKN
jgi:hypothetical protein